MLLIFWCACCVTIRRFGHVVAVVGYNFSSSNASQHYWLIKDSLPAIAVQQHWKVSRQQHNSI
jgi:hypothetical protein